MSSGGQEWAVFVGDLASDVTDDALLEFFSDSYTTTCSAKVIKDVSTGRPKGFGFVHFSKETDRDRAIAEMHGVLLFFHVSTGRPKGFGFVHFSKETDRDRAIAEMHGVLLSSRVIRVSQATGSKNKPMGKGAYNGSTRTSDGASSANAAHPADYDPTNTTLFVGGLSSCVTETQLRDIFAKFGEIIYTKGKGCGFVQFVDRGAAQFAIHQMNGAVIGNSAIRISWGRSSSKLAAAMAQGSFPTPIAPMTPIRPPMVRGNEVGNNWSAYPMPLFVPPPHAGGGGGMPWGTFPSGAGAYPSAAPAPFDPYYQYYYYQYLAAGGTPQMGFKPPQAWDRTEGGQGTLAISLS
eukprot:gene9663-8486_t